GSARHPVRHSAIRWNPGQAVAHPRYQRRGAARHHLQLPAGHGASDLRRARADRHILDQGEHGSRCRTAAHLSAGHDAACGSRPVWRAGSHLHSGGRRLRRPDHSRRHQRPDGREPHCDADLGLAEPAPRLCNGGDAHRAASRRAHRSRPPAHDSPAPSRAPAGSTAVTAPPKHRPTNGGRIVLLAWMTAIFVFLYLPILVIVIYSFNGGRNLYVWTEWSTHWYGEAIDNPRALRALLVSIRPPPINAAF